MKYLVRVTETLAHSVIVEANDQIEALTLAERAYELGTLVLDYDDYDESNIEVVREARECDTEIYDMIDLGEYKG